LAERLLLRALQFCAERGVTQLVAVSTLPVERLMHRAGLDVHRIGPPSMIGGQPVLAFVIAVNERSIAALSEFETAVRETALRRRHRDFAAVQGFEPMACAA